VEKGTQEQQLIVVLNIHSNFGNLFSFQEVKALGRSHKFPCGEIGMVHLQNLPYRIQTSHPLWMGV